MRGRDPCLPVFWWNVAKGEATGPCQIPLRTESGVTLDRSSQTSAGSGAGQAAPASRGADFVALSRVFLYAGAPAVACLWEVDDESTSYLMIELYRHLRTGRGLAQALREAQAKARVRYPAPHDWAAFVLMGAPGAPAAL
jgi:hypothetical protein